LQLRCIARSTYSPGGSPSYGDSSYLQFNGDTGSNYSEHYLGGNGSSVTSFQASGPSATFMNISDGNGPWANMTANAYGTNIIDILDYTNTNKAKTVRILNGFDANGVGRTNLQSGLWLNSSSAITSINFTFASGSAAQQYSSFALYGVR